MVNCCQTKEKGVYASYNPNCQAINMIGKLKYLFRSGDNKRLLTNFLSLSSLQMANYLLPLITLPYLVRTLGVDYYGLIAFATATITYFVLLTDYGFNLTATKDISIHRSDAEKVNEIVSMVMTIKLLLLLCSFILLNVLVFSFDRFAFH